MVIAEQCKMDELVYNLAKEIRLIVFDFDGVFTDNRVLVMQDGTEAVLCWRGDGLGLSAVKALHINVMVLSTETNSVVSVDKAQALKQFAEDSRVPLEKVAYMGNDINDLGCLNIVGLPACVSDSHPDVLSAALYVSKIKGGHGAVREFCDFIAGVKTGKIGHDNQE